MSEKVTIQKLQKMKQKGEKIAMITAYDALFARLFDDYADMVLVGDSLNMSFGGKNETVGLSVKQMIYHAKAVKSALTKPFFVVDMPFGSTVTPEVTLKNALEIYVKTGCDAVKIEGGEEMAETIEMLTKNGIAVMGHVGLLPQKMRLEGGFRVKGRSESGAKQLKQDVLALRDAGVKTLVVEGLVSSAVSEVVAVEGVISIGIGAGAKTDGQVLVWSDLLGFFEGFKPKFVKRYMEGSTLVREAVARYVSEVKSGVFPSSEFEYLE